MRVVHYVDAVRLSDGGTARALLDMCAAVAAAGTEVVLMTRDASDVPFAWTDGSPERPRRVVLDPARRPLGRASRSALARAREAILDADVLHLHGVWEPANAQMAALARRLGRPYIVSLHGMLDDWCMRQRRVKKRVYLALIGRRMLEGAALIHCTARSELEQSSAWFGHRRARVVPLILDLGPFRELPGPGPARARFAGLGGAAGRPVVLFLGRLDPIKGLDALLHAAADLRSRGQETTLVLAGSGDAAYQEHLRGRAAALGLAERVVFTGPVFGADKVSLYQAADAFVLASHHENFGLVAFESLASALPVVTTRAVGSWPDLEASGGALVTDGTPDGLADALRRLLSNADMRRSMSDAGRRWTLHNLDSSRVVPAYLSLYAEATGSASSPPRATSQE